MIVIVTLILLRIPFANLQMRHVFFASEDTYGAYDYQTLDMSVRVCRVVQGAAAEPVPARSQLGPE
jgi:hypothetical protein